MTHNANFIGKLVQKYAIQPTTAVTLKVNDVVTDTSIRKEVNTKVAEGVEARLLQEKAAAEQAALAAAEQQKIADDARNKKLMTYGGIGLGLLLFLSLGLFAIFKLGK